MGVIASGGVEGLVRRSEWAAPLLMMFVGFLVCDFVVAAQSAGVWYHALQVIGAENARKSLYSVFVSAFPSWESAAHLFLFILLIGIFDRGRMASRSFRLGVLSGSLFACGYTIVEVMGIAPSLTTSQPEFWRALHRVAGTFTDPNAEGIFLALALAVCAPMYCSRKGPAGLSWDWRVVFVGAVSLAAFLLAGVYSGSRSFLLGIAALMLGWLYLLSRRVFVAGVGVVLLGVAGISILDSRTALISDLVSKSWVPEGVSRVVESLALGRSQESFASRTVFLNMTLELIKSAPVFGVGPSRFRHFVPAVAQQEGIGLNGWTDNSNNFYLGWIAELGMVGGILLLITLSARSFGRGGRSGAVGLFMLGVLLLTGPHLDFLEVAILASFLIAEQSEVAVAVHTGYFRRSISICAVLAGILASWSRERGVYGWEKEGGAYHQWLSPVATLSARCTCDGLLRLNLQSFTGSAAHPTTARISGAGLEKVEVEFSSPAVRRIVVPCFAVSQTALDFTPPKVLLNITTDPAWIPARRFKGESSDARVLGVRIRERISSDLLDVTRCEAR